MLMLCHLARFKEVDIISYKLRGPQNRGHECTFKIVHAWLSLSRNFTYWPNFSFNARYVHFDRIHCFYATVD